MRILVISLLRLGDFIQTVPLLNGLRAKPGVSVDVLVHNPTARMSGMVPAVDFWWTLNRDELQAGLGQTDVPTLTSFHVLKETLDQISEENYDLVINVTHTRFSGYLMGYLRAKAKLGLAIDEFERARFHSAWFRYLDQHAHNPVDDVLNYSDIFLQACGIKSASWSMQPGPKGENELNDLNLDSGPYTVCQVLTSDSKKNWSFSAWSDCLGAYQARRPEQKIILLGAPNEREPLAELQKMLMARGVTTALGILSLEGALALLNKANLLITGDTSIKHLANAGRARIVEISLGSSDYRRTGVYKSDSLIIGSGVTCAPCSHSASCPQRSHLCGESLNPKAIGDVCADFLDGDWNSIREVASTSGFEAYRTRRLSTGFWLASDLNSEAAVMRAMLNRSTWKFLIDREHRVPLTTIGSEGVRLHEELRALIPGDRPILQDLDFLERELIEVQKTSERNLSLIPRSVERGHTVSMQEARRKQIELNEKSEGAEIQKKLIRSLKSQLMENP